MSQGNLAVRPRTALTSKVATEKNINIELYFYLVSREYIANI